ncbi:hypothetical protein D6C86_10125 [Aureobasidium pullulans]|uniref:Uncharacterized protein n=1 Tax=Aureobasidium pullulans TaxID=5580 RepID=A0A4S9UAH5_AURPU|nr:hypothetical protein D6C94_08078 [Aureobasidium pullulans]THZ34347.1 hypothetical protein D6C87_10465 [Aureobasidium pullulans]THZ52712.1 hypothetical protein D6C86_10125 [Aureobasidium pullulans]
MAAAADADDDDNNNDRNTSTTPTDELPTKGREVLGELTPNLDGEADQSTVQDEEQDITDEVAESRDLGHDEVEKDVDEIEDEEAGAKVEKASTSTPAASASPEKPNHIPIHQDDSLKLPVTNLDAGSPTTELPLLNITPQRTPAKKVMKNEFAHMRSTSNKENMVPDPPVVAGPVDRLQTHVEYLGSEQDQPQTATDAQHSHQPQDGHENGNEMENHNHQEITNAEPESTQTDEAQDDSLIGHFEALHVSPKKAQKFVDPEAESETQSGAEQSVPEQPHKAEETIKTNGATDQAQQEAPKDIKKEAPNAEKKPNVGQKLQPKDKQANSTSPVAKKVAPQTSQSDTTKLARKPSIRQSTVTRQSSVVRKSMAPRPEPSTNTAIKRTTSVKRSSVRPSIAPRAGSSQSAERGPPAPIPHSKPRPMSMSFPTPPPPPKSSKAPTQATFQLGGEAVAARLKAEKEERLKRQAEGTAAKPTYKPPPPPKSTKAPTRATFQLPGEAIAAKLKADKEERQKRLESEGPAKKSTFVPPVTQKSTKPVTKATFQLSSDAFAAKMKAQKEERARRAQEEEEKMAAQRKQGFKARPAPKIKEPALVRQTAASRARLPSNDTNTGGLKRATSVREPTSTAAKRQSSFQPSVSTSSTMTLPPRASTSFQKRQSTAAPFVSKGKEVFSRAAEKKEKEDREKKDKEDAAKKARVEAAEKGRLASREWAARRKSKVVAGAAGAAAPAAV